MSEQNNTEENVIFVAVEITIKMTKRDFLLLSNENKFIPAIVTGIQATVPSQLVSVDNVEQV
jgi:hypothetical protein